MNILSEIEREMCKKKPPKFNVGDTVDVHIKVIEGDKERIQVFNGIVIARKGAGLRETFSVRRIVQGEGVERVFPLHSPRLTKVLVKRQGQPRRAKLYYLRGRKGKSVKVKERLGMVAGVEIPTSDVGIEEPETKESPKPKSPSRPKGRQLQRS